MDCDYAVTVTGTGRRILVLYHMHSGRVDRQYLHRLFVRTLTAHDNDISLAYPKQLASVCSNWLPLVIRKPNGNGWGIGQFLLAEWTTVWVMPWLALVCFIGRFGNQKRDELVVKNIAFAASNLSDDQNLVLRWICNGLCDRNCSIGPVLQNKLASPCLPLRRLLNSAARQKNDETKKRARQFPHYLFPVVVNAVSDLTAFKMQTAFPRHYYRHMHNKCKSNAICAKIFSKTQMAN